MRVLFVCPYPQAKAASQRFRFEQFLDDLEFDFDLEPFWNEKQWQLIYKEGGFLTKTWGTVRALVRRFWLVSRLSKYDKIFIHREASPIGPPWFEWFAAKVFKKEVIFDFDDAIWLPNSSDANRKIAGKFKYHQKTAKICKWSKIVVVGNKYLANYAKKYASDIRVIPTIVDTENYHNPDLHKKCIGQERRTLNNLNSSEVKTIGWTGTHSTLRQLEPVLPLLEILHQKIPFRFLLISDTPPSKVPSFVEFRQWNQHREIEDLLEIDVGIMPLFDTQWEKGKCGFKAIQYQALKKPAVVSNVGVNSKVVLDGITGFVCETLSDDQRECWLDALMKLLSDDRLRDELGQNARSHVAQNYSIESQKSSFLGLF